MKRRKISFAISATVLAITSFAFTNARSAKQVSYYWFVGNTYQDKYSDPSVEGPAIGCTGTSLVVCERGYTLGQLNTGVSPYTLIDHASASYTLRTIN